MFPCEILIPTIQTSQKILHFPFFSDGNISVLNVEKSVRGSVFGVSKFQILDGAFLTKCVVRHSVFPNSKFQILGGAQISIQIEFFFFFCVFEHDSPFGLG
jgi:hypothetical protein